MNIREVVSKQRLPFTVIECTDSGLAIVERLTRLLTSQLVIPTVEIACVIRCKPINNIQHIGVCRVRERPRNTTLDAGTAEKREVEPETICSRSQ